MTLVNVDIPPVFNCCFHAFKFISLVQHPTYSQDTRLYLNFKCLDESKLKWDEVRREMTRCLVLFASYTIILIDIFRTNMNYLFNKLSF